MNEEERRGRKRRAGEGRGGNMMEEEGIGIKRREGGQIRADEIRGMQRKENA